MEIIRSLISERFTFFCASFKGVKGPTKWVQIQLIYQIYAVILRLRGPPGPLYTHTPFKYIVYTLHIHILTAVNLP